MSKALYKIKELFKESGIKQIIIPEIQRDYVWSSRNVEKLLKSIIEDARANVGEKYQKLKEQLETAIPEVREILERELKAQVVFSNIGFIYAYEDDELKNRYFLIDGQQRITTIYLLLLAVSLKNGKGNYFASNYFVDSLPKVDYKVREESHNFMVLFIKHLLNGGKVADVTDQSWFYDVYNNDITISSILTNYKIIENYIADKDISIEYVEENIEIWFFDINKSKQGEELYIYMNSRGEEVKANENIKAGLLEGCSEEEKNIWGAKWEDWQDFFWKNKVDNINADQGFNEFIRWIIIIEYVKSNPELPVEQLGRFIKQIKQNDKFSFDILNLELIKTYYESFSFLFGHKQLCEKSWGSGNTSMVDYIRLFPALMYLNKVEQPDVDELRRLIRFFKNVTRLEDIAKNPDNQTVNAIRLLEAFLSDGYTDVVDLVHYLGKNPAFSSIITDEEFYKLSIFKNPPKEATREVVEQLFWETEDLNLLNGQLSFVFNAIGDEMEDISKFEYEKFKAYANSFVKLFKKPNDNLRRALLVKGDYTVYDGFSPSIWSERYTFGHDINSWKKIISEHPKIIVRLLADYVDKMKKGSSEDKILNEIVSNYLNKQSDKGSWMLKFINYPEVFTYCEQKKICYLGEELENIILLKRTKATTYKTLKDFLKSK